MLVPEPRRVKNCLHPAGDISGNPASGELLLEQIQVLCQAEKCWVAPQRRMQRQRMYADDSWTGRQFSCKCLAVVL